MIRSSVISMIDIWIQSPLQGEKPSAPKLHLQILRPKPRFDDAFHFTQKRA